MQQLLCIHFKDGRRRWIDLSSYVSSEPFGQNIATELDLRLDDISKGLYLEVSYNTLQAEDKPEWGQAPQEADERGYACKLAGGAYYCILGPEDLATVSQVESNGDVLLKAFGDQHQLVVLEKLNTLCLDYLSDAQSTFDCIAALYPILYAKHTRLLGSAGSDMSAEDVDRAIALEMGITTEILAEARSLAESFDDDDEDEDETYELPWGDGEHD